MKNFYIILIIVTVFGCEKDDPNISKQDPFEIGLISANSIYNKYEPPMQLTPDNLVDYNYFVNDTIDIDDDGLYDIILSITKRESDMSLRESSEIWIYNKNFEIAYEIIEDSLYHFQYSLDDSSYTAITSAKINFTPPTSYDKTVEYFGHSEPKTLSDGGTPNDSYNWMNSGTTISSRVNETVYNYKDATHYNTIAASSWNNSGEKYILLRLNKNNLEYYGWIKLEIQNVSSLIVYETYFQKNGF